MNFIKGLFAFFLSLLALYIMYYYIHIPIIPSFIFYIFVALVSKFNCTNKYINMLFIILLGIISICTYILSIFLSISEYPNYLNFIGIILEFITLFSIISSFFFNLSGLKKD